MSIKQLCLGAGCLVFVLPACQKGINTVQPLSESRDTSVVVNNTPLACHAGKDVTLQLPLDSVQLAGSYVSTRAIKKVEWKMIAGTGGHIEDPFVLNPKIKALQAGIYHFQLAVTDDVNGVAMDTVKLTVLDGKTVTTAQGSVLYQGLTWIFPWYSTVEAPNIYTYVPKNAPIKVYIQRGGDTSWIEVPLLSPDTNNHVYEYFIETRPDGAGMYNFGSLYVFYYGPDVSDRPHLKVTF